MNAPQNTKGMDGLSRRHGAQGGRKRNYGVSPEKPKGMPKMKKKGATPKKATSVNANKELTEEQGTQKLKPREHPVPTKG